MGSKKGQPRTSQFVRFTIAYKVVQYLKAAQKRSHKLTVRQAWLKLSDYDKEKDKWKKRGFQELLEEHYKNREFSKHFINQLKDRTYRINFYKNNVKKFVDEYLTNEEKIVEDKIKRWKSFLSKIKKNKR